MAQWHFEKKLSLDTLVAIVGIAIVIGGPLVFAWRSMESRILTIEITQDAQAKATVLREAQDIAARTSQTQTMTTMSDRLTQVQIDLAKLVGQTAPVVLQSNGGPAIPSSRIHR